MLIFLFYLWIHSYAIAGRSSTGMQPILHVAPRKTASPLKLRSHTMLLFKWRVTGIPAISPGDPSGLWYPSAAFTVLLNVFLCKPALFLVCRCVQMLLQQSCVLRELRASMLNVQTVQTWRHWQSCHFSIGNERSRIAATAALVTVRHLWHVLVKCTQGETV